MSLDDGGRSPWNIGQIERAAIERVASQWELSGVFDPAVAIDVTEPEETNEDRAARLEEMQRRVNEGYEG